MTYAAWEKKRDVLIQEPLSFIEYTFSLLSILKAVMGNTWCKYIWSAAYAISMKKAMDSYWRNRIFCVIKLKFCHSFVEMINLQCTDFFFIWSNLSRSSEVLPWSYKTRIHSHIMYYNNLKIFSMVSNMSLSRAPQVLDSVLGSPIQEKHGGQSSRIS